MNKNLADLDTKNISEKNVKVAEVSSISYEQYSYEEIKFVIFCNILIFSNQIKFLVISFVFVIKSF